MKSDANKGISKIRYNSLNLPENITKGSKTIAYTYSATGEKLENRLPDNKKLQYCGNFVYENGSLKYILNEEGKLNVGSGNQQYQFFVKDHLGNTRLAVAENGSIDELNHYYPFGMRMGMSSSKKDPDQKYLYNGKEMQEETDWLDYGARMYDASTARWHVIDPMAELMSNNSPYVYVLNNPTNAIDPDGEMPQFVVGFIVGAGTEYATQVIGNVISDGFSMDAFTNNINGSDILVEGLAGMASGGLSKIGKIGKLLNNDIVQETLKSGVKTIINKKDGDIQSLDEGVATVLIDGMLASGSKLGIKNPLNNKINNSLSKASSELQSASGAMKSAERKLKNASSPSQVRRANNKLQTAKENLSLKSKQNASAAVLDVQNPVNTITSIYSVSTGSAKNGMTNILKRNDEK